MRRRAVAGFGTALVASLAMLASGAAGQAGIETVEVIGTEFRVTLADGTTLSGAALVGAVLTLAVPGGEAQDIRIDGVQPDSADPEITLYDLSVRNPLTGGWSNPCNPDPEGLMKAFPMKGTPAPDGEYHPEAPGFSLTCTAGVQAKCVRWGYRPWEPAVGGVSTLELYRTCMRLARADYCGDGEGATRDGTPIDLYDIAGIQRPEPVSAMRFEAAWGPDGAICVNHTRLPDVLTLEELARRCPRLALQIGDSCSEDTPGALMFNKSF
jgi:hypothetical protein